MHDMGININHYYIVIISSILKTPYKNELVNRTAARCHCLRCAQESAAPLSPPADSRREDTWLWKHPASLLLLRRRLVPPHSPPSSVAGDRESALWLRDGWTGPERSSAPRSPDGGVSEDAPPQFHLCVGVPVHGRDHGGSVPELHVPLRRRPDLAGAHAPLHAHPVRARPADPHLHPPGPEQGPAARPAAAHPAARTHRQVSGDVFTCVSLMPPPPPQTHRHTHTHTHTHIQRTTVFFIYSAPGHETSVITHRCRFHGWLLSLKTCPASVNISCLLTLGPKRCPHAVVFICSRAFSPPGWLHTCPGQWEPICGIGNKPLINDPTRHWYAPHTVCSAPTVRALSLSAGSPPAHCVIVFVVISQAELGLSYSWNHSAWSPAHIQRLTHIHQCGCCALMHEHLHTSRAEA